MRSPLTELQFQARFAAYTRERSIVAVLGWAPFLLIYVLVHTKYLRPYVPENKTAAVGLLILLPAAWCASVLLAHSWVARYRYGVRCSGCGYLFGGQSLKRAAAVGCCERCGAPLVVPVAGATIDRADR